MPFIAAKLFGNWKKTSKLVGFVLVGMAAGSLLTGQAQAFVFGSQRQVSQWVQAGASLIGLRTETNNLRIGSSGTLFVDTENDKVGIGTTAPSDKLDVQGGNIRNSTLASAGNRCVYADSNGVLHIKADDCGLAGTSGDNLGDHVVMQNLRMNDYWLSNDGDNEGIRIGNSGNVGVGITGPTAKLHLKAGTAAATTAPLKFTSGALLSASEAGAVEFLTDAYYGTITTGAARKQFAFTDSNITGNAATATNLVGLTATVANLNSVTGLLGTAAFTASTDYATSAQGTLATNALPAASFTDAAVTGKLITGFTSGAGTVAATDTILQAINKLNGNTDLKAPIASPTFTGTVTIPTPFTLDATSVTATGAELNILDGVTATTAELNIMDGVTATAAKLNYLASAAGTTGTNTTNLVFSTSPTLVTPVLGAATATSINGNTITTGTGTLTLGAGKTLTASNTITFTATDGATLAIGGGGTLGTGAYATIANYAPLASPTFTGTVTIPSPFTLGATSVTATGAELNILDGVTATTAELNYVDGVTSAIQTQLNLKAPLASPTFTGTITAAAGTFSGTLTANGTLDANGAVTLGDGGDNVTIDSNVWDITAAGAISGVTTVGISGQLTSTLATGTSPFAITSTTLNANLNTDLLDGEHGSYYADIASRLGYTPSRSATSVNSVYSLDSRSTNYEPQGRDAGLYADFKSNTTDGLSDGGTYHGVLTFRGYGSGSDLSGGYPMQIGYTANGNLWTRLGTSTTAWGSWYKLWNQNNDGASSGLDADLLDGQHGSYYASLASPTFTGTVTIPTPFTLGATSVTATGAELNILDGVTATTAELNYVDGVTSAIQTQLNLKAPLASPTFTGAITLPGTGTSQFATGGADNASYTTNNIQLSGWWGLGMYNPTSGGTYPNQVSGFYNFREGYWDTKSYPRVNGTAINSIFAPLASPAFTGTITAAAGTFSGTLTANGTLDANAAVTLGDGGDNVTIDSNVWDITAAGAISGVTTVGISGQLTSTLATGTSPFAITSTTLNANLNTDLLDGQEGSYYDQRVYNSATNYLGGGYVSGGLEKPNWSGFGAGKLKLQMLSGSNLGAPGTWNDVLWMSSYTGGDVKTSNALIFSKYGPRIGLVQQAYDSASWGTYYEVWNSGSDGSGSGLDADLLDGQHGSYYAPLASPTFTGTVTIPSPFTLGATSVTATGAELNILDGVTATAAELNKLDGVTATATELNYTDGVTSAIQTQLNLKAPLASPTFTGTLTAPSPPIVSAITSATSGAINFPQVTVPYGSFATFIHGATYETSRGYIDHISIGDYRDRDANWGSIFFGIGGNDSYPTSYFLMRNDGILSHSSGNISLGGNVGIGTTNPGYKLHVTGDIYANGGWLRTSGSMGWYSESYGGGWYMSDTSWLRTYNSKSIWTNSGLLGSSGGLTVGYGGTAPSSGGAIISGSVGIGTSSPGTIGAKVAIQNNTDGVNRILTAMIPDLSGTAWFGIGRAASAYDSGWIGFANSGGTGSQSNYMSLAMFGVDAILNITGYGRVGVGIVNPSYQFQVSSDSAGKPNGGTWANSSDMRLKTNIATMTGALDKLTQLRGVNFNWINQDEHLYEQGLQGGFIAQEVESVFPNWVKEVDGIGKDGVLTGGKTKSLSLPFEFDALLVEAIKEQQGQIKELKLSLDNFGLINSTSTIANSSDTANPFQWVASGLQSLGMTLRDGVASLKEVIAVKFTGGEANIGKVQTEQMTARQMCVSGIDGETVCLTKDQLKDLIAKAGSSVTISKTYVTDDIPAAIKIPAHPPTTDSTSTESGQ